MLPQKIVSSHVVRATIKARTTKITLTLDEHLCKTRIVGMIATIGRGQDESDGLGGKMLPFKHVNSAFFEAWTTQRSKAFTLPLERLVNPANMLYVPVELQSLSMDTNVSVLKEFDTDYTIFFTFFTL
ncbi:MAG: hypothetical protein RLZZ628_2881 [Bacteroidota bacterium]|jgi:hypothetical protein